MQRRLFNSFIISGEAIKGIACVPYLAAMDGAITLWLQNARACVTIAVDRIRMPMHIAFHEVKSPLFRCA